MKKLFSIKIILLLMLPGYCQQAGNPFAQQEIGITEKLGDYLPKNLEIINETGDTILFSDLLDKPTVLTLVYYRCPGICTPLMDAVAGLIEKSDLELGKDYQVLTVSFDHREGPYLAKQKKGNYLSILSKKEQAKEGWKFFTADSSNVIALTEAVGFKYQKQANDFIHTTGLIILDQEGQICRYLNGVDFLPFELKLSLMEASEGKTMPTVNKLVQYCFSYDPQGQEYVLNITRVSGIVIIFFSLVFFLFLAIRSFLKRNKNKA